MKETQPSSLISAIRTAVLWCAAFAFACAWFLAGLKLLRGLPPTPAVGIGKVTVEGASKARDYAAAALFYVVVPVLSVVFARIGERWYRRLTRSARFSSTTELGTTALFALPFVIAPFFYLTTRKELWGILLPPVLATAAVRAVAHFQTRRSFRELFAPELRPYQWLIIFEGSAWLLFRYLATGKRIAHIPTLFLEVVFVAFFLLLFWLLAYFVARMAALLSGRETSALMASFATGAIPMLILPFAALFIVSEKLIVAVAYPLIALTIALAIIRGHCWAPERTSKLVKLVVAPALIFCISYASTAQLSRWVDLFHRGESLGPASDYLRGKVPYRDVFVLHGMLENGLMDSWLMRLFGRHVEVALARLILIGALTIPVIWLITIVVLDSIPLALLASLLGYVISADNQRALPELIVALLILIAVKRRSVVPLILSGVFTAIAVFYSLDIGLYSLIGATLSLMLLSWMRVIPWLWLGWFAAGAGIGALPFLFYLAAHGALAPFFQTSFLVIPSIIDAIWSVPYPDFASLFRDFSVRTLADFVLTERFRFILNPLVLGIAAAYLLAPLTPGASPRRGEGNGVRGALLILVVFAIITQRSAMGRADFPHQYFSAFLLPPILVIFAASIARFFRRLWPTASIAERTLIASLLVFAVPVILTVLWVPDLLNARLDATITYRPRVSRIGFYDPAAEINRDRIGAVQKAVQQLAPLGGMVFDFSNQPALYFFTNRVNPTRFYQVPVLSPIDHQMEAIADLASARPRVVFRGSPENYHAFDGIRNELRAPAVAAYLDDHYAFDRNVRGIELWRRTERAPQPLSRYRRMFRLPTATSVAPLDRFIFPSVGSVHGAADSIWRSDLLLHNPHRDPARLRLRYIGTTGTRDRDLVLAPGKSLQLVDVVGTFFSVPETRGTLWIEYPADRRPLVRVVTYDLTRGGTASIDPPLFENDAATADTVLNELTIVGARGGGPIRVNLGVINVGIAPAHFKITTTTAAGDIIGVPAEGLLMEDESFLLVDAGRELGVPFEQPVVVHVRMVTGKAIAYASVINSDTGTQHFIPGVPAQAR